MNSITALDVNLESLIDKVLTQKIQKNDRDYSHFHPSEFDQCHRKLVYKYYQSKGICSPSDVGSLIDPRLQRIFDNGHGLHERLGANLEATGMLRGLWRCLKCGQYHGKEEKLGVHKPKKCSSCSSAIGFHYHELGFHDEDTMLGGHVDAVLDLRGQEINGKYISDSQPDDETHIIVDFKSIRAEAFRKLVEPKESHLVQMKIYLYLSGLKTGKFLYENKNDQSFREFLVVATPETQDLVARAKILKKIVTNTNTEGKWTLPVRAHKKDNTKECVECPFRSHCWGLKK